MRSVTSQPVAEDGALECPATLADERGTTVPEKPQGVDGNARLLPDREPETLVVCRYPVLDVMTGSLKAPFALESRNVVAANQRQTVVDLLTWAPRGTTEGRACTAMAGNESVHLVGATYGDAIVWVAAKADANSCSGATNGDFESRAPVGGTLERLYGDDPGPVTPPAEQPTCVGWSTGRLGDDQTLVPEGSPTVTVCRLAASGSWQETPLDEDRSAQVVTELRQLPIRPTLGMCEGADPGADDAFRLVLSYPRGPSVHVGVTPSCRPPVLGGGVESAEVGELVELVEQWSPPIPAPDPDAPVSSDGSGSPGSTVGSAGSDGSGVPAAPTGTGTGTGTEGSVDPVAPRSQPQSEPDARVTTVP
ncbi:hypothetical protein [Intrasporangium sp.]|uniref:hypothetical protein n=1 Tax=Intrasporangium sp. TaxID=1925024 RepID=UPI0029395FC9|nr:hypothetical protein [Intrasporangium sp.]MDV3221078.1 hypothetical protein [Intrasporangium sp.]